MTKLPNFFLKMTDGSLIKSSQLKKTILFFYPKAMTSGCTVEVQDFQSYLNKFKKLNFKIIGVSKDSVDKNLKFAKKYDLQYLLGSDEDKVCEKLEIWIEKSMYGKKYFGIDRSTFIIDKNGKIFEKWNKVKVGGHVEEVLKKALTCP